MTYRLGHHSTSDDSTAYRKASEVAEWTEKDYPILRFRRYLERNGWWNDEDDKAWIAQVRKDVLKHFTAAEKVKNLPVDELFNDVYAEVPKHLQKQKAELKEHLAKYGEHYPLNKFQS